MSKLLNFGRRFSRDCFLILGGAFLLIAFGSLAGNLPDIIRFGDWPASQVREMLLTAAFFAVSGAIFSVAAYGLFKSRRWSVHFAVVVSALALTFMVVSVAADTIERVDFATSLSFYAVPLLFALIWAVAEETRERKERKTIAGDEGRGNQLA